MKLSNVALHVLSYLKSYKVINYNVAVSHRSCFFGILFLLMLWDLWHVCFCIYLILFWHFIIVLTTRSKREVLCSGTFVTENLQNTFLFEIGFDYLIYRYM
jgi:hypothetical protein